jgi:hypothetical protein
VAHRDDVFIKVMILLDGLPAPFFVFTPKLGWRDRLHLLECFRKMTLVKKACLDRTISDADIGI